MAIPLARCDRYPHVIQLYVTRQRTAEILVRCNDFFFFFLYDLSQHIRSICFDAVLEEAVASAELYSLSLSLPHLPLSCMSDPTLIVWRASCTTQLVAVTSEQRVLCLKMGVKHAAGHRVVCLVLTALSAEIHRISLKRPTLLVALARSNLRALCQGRTTIYTHICAVFEVCENIWLCSSIYRPEPQIFRPTVVLTDLQDHEH